MPGARRTHCFACKNEKDARKPTQVRRNHSGTPCAMGLRLLRALPGVPGFLATIASRVVSQDLISASGDQDHTTWPSAPASPVLRHKCGHRIPRSTFVTTRTPLFMSAGRRDEDMTSGFRK